MAGLPARRDDVAIPARIAVRFSLVLEVVDELDSFVFECLAEVGAPVEVPVGVTVRVAHASKTRTCFRNGQRGGCCGE